ncbi:MAG: RNA polymerase sigma factor [Acidimicrobiia bacterium]
MPRSPAPGPQIDLERRFDSLFELHYVTVYRYCLRRLGRADGEDAAAEVLAIAWRRLDEIPPGDAARGWLLGVAYRVVGNQYRGRRRRARLSTRLRAEEEAVPAIVDSSASEEVRLLHRALESLRATDRELLRLASWDGLTRSEIATLMGIKENAVDQRLFRARSRLKDRLDRLATDTQPISARKAST